MLAAALVGTVALAGCKKKEEPVVAPPAAVEPAPAPAEPVPAPAPVSATSVTVGNTVAADKSVAAVGMFGVKDFAAVINPPHATILAVGVGEERAVVRKGEIVVANVMSVTLSTDHRAVDGALGAELLQAFRKYIENPMSMLV